MLIIVIMIIIIIIIIIMIIIIIKKCRFFQTNLEVFPGEFIHDSQFIHAP